MQQQTLENTDENLAKVVENNDRVVLTRDGDPIAVVLSIDDYRSLEATVALIRDPTISGVRLPPRKG